MKRTAMLMMTGMVVVPCTCWASENGAAAICFSSSDLSLTVDMVISLL